MQISTVHFEYTTDCNSRCAMCDYWKSGSSLEIRNGTVKSAFASLMPLGLKKAYFTGGECLLHAEHLFSICSEIRSAYPELELGLITNGILLKKYAYEIGRIFSKVIVSLDTVDREKYMKIRGVDALPGIQRGIHSLRELYPDMRINLRMLVLNDTVEDILPVIQYAVQEKLHHVSFLPEDVNSSTAFGRRQSTEIVSHHNAECLAHLRQIIDELQDQHSALFGNILPRACTDLEYIYSVYTGSPRNHMKCNKAEKSCVINADGTVNPCFFIRSEQSIACGKQVTDVLESEMYRALVSAIQANQHAACRNCACPKELS